MAKKFGHGLECILKHADVAVQWDSCNFYDQLCAGISLNKGTKRYWLDKKTNCNGIFLYARALSIAWSDNCEYWKWIIIEESCHKYEVAELQKVSWLDIRGTIQASVLSPNIQYEVIFVIKLKKDASGWEIPVNIELKKSNEIIHERKEYLSKLSKGEWVELLVGTFSLCGNDPCPCNQIEFSLCEHGGHWKRGLSMKSAVIRPKPPC